MSHVCIIYDEQLVWLGAGSGMCELTNQSRMGIQEGGRLKRQELQQGVSDRAAALDAMRKTNAYFDY